jgi:hypothetical protein
LKNQISKEEALRLFEIAGDCLRCCSQDSLYNLSERFKNLVSSEYLVTGYMSLAPMQSQLPWIIILSPYSPFNDFQINPV